MISFNEAIELVKKRPYKIGHMLGFDDLTELHNEWIKEFVYGEDDYTLRAHRGSYKTSCIEVALALIILLYPNDSTLFIRKTYDDVEEVIKTISRFLESDIFQLLSFALYNSDLNLNTEHIIIDKTTDTQTILNTNLKSTLRGTPQLVGLGTSTAPTGKHFERIFTDDIINIKDRAYESERKRIKNYYMELQNVKNRGGRIVNTGTPWHKEDAFCIMPPAIDYPWQETGLISKEGIQEIRKKMTPSLFAANYELKHIADENALFTNPQFFNDDKLLYNGLAHVDAAYGGEDRTAFTIMKLDQDGEIYAIGKLYKKHVNNCILDMKICSDRFLAGTWLNERNADKGYLSEKLSEMDIPNFTYSEHTNKHIKICTHLYRNWAHIHWHEETDAEYMNQILDYTEEAQHDDAPDSAASLCRHLTGNQITVIKGLMV